MMYGALWRLIPGPPWLKLFVVLVLAALVVAVCMEWVFPAIANYMPFNDGTVEKQ